MLILIIGLVLFFGPHFVPFFPAYRNSLYERLGEKRYKGGFSLIALAGLVLIVFGYSRAAYTDLWAPFPWSRNLALYLMPVSLTLFAAANMKTLIRRYLRHPMAVGTIVFAAVHLSANGDLASVLVFGSFGLYAILSVISGEARGRVLGDGPAAVKYDLFSILGGVGIYFVILKFHGVLFGVSVL
ncbi:MAG: NnrU family protein [Gammaproteobacteria bacterium]|nr:NnrU family protein [Gammaproteobacteria bacterium]